MNWEQIDDYHKRAKVHGGWLVKTYEEVMHNDTEMQRMNSGYDWRVSMCFVPDINHEWSLTND